MRGLMAHFQITLSNILKFYISQLLPFLFINVSLFLGESQHKQHLHENFCFQKLAYIYFIIYIMYCAYKWIFCFCFNIFSQRFAWSKKRKSVLNLAHCLIYFITTLFRFICKHKFVFMAKIKKLDKQFPSVRIWSHLCDTTQIPSPPSLPPPLYSPKVS